MATAKQLELEAETIERFRRDLDALVALDAPVGVAVSGGPDSLALLLIAAEARPVDGRGGDRRSCAAAGKPRRGGDGRAGLRAPGRPPRNSRPPNGSEKPETAIQERARAMRYRLLGDWARERGLARAGHRAPSRRSGRDLPDAARARAGVRGLAGMRRVARLPDGDLALVRPLLGWRHSELEAVCAAAGLDPVARSEQRRRAIRARPRPPGAGRFRAGSTRCSGARAPRTSPRPTPRCTGRPPGMAARGQPARATRSSIAPADAPREIRRRIVRRAVLALATEGGGAELRGRELDSSSPRSPPAGRRRSAACLCTGGAEWRFTKAPAAALSGRCRRSAPSSAQIRARRRAGARPRPARPAARRKSGCPATVQPWFAG